MLIMSQACSPTSQSGPYRGAGPEAASFMERLIEHAARETGIDLPRSAGAI